MGAILPTEEVFDMIQPVHDIRVEFQGDSGEGPLTWGQRAIWAVFAWLPPDDASLNLVEVCPIAPGRELTDVAAAVRTVVERHASLRTTVRREPTGPRQVVRGRGSITIEVIEADAADLPQIERRLAAAPFDHGRDLLVRVAVRLEHGRPREVVLAVSHFAADGWSMRILGADLTDLLAGRRLPARSAQPLSRARWEDGPIARRRQQRAFEHWRRGAAELPPIWMTGLDRDDTITGRWAELDSPALAAAVRHLSAIHRLTTGMTLQSLVSLILAIRQDETETGLRCIVATRSQPEFAQLVAAFNQNALLRLTVTDEDQAAFFRRARTAALVALATTECEPDEMEDLVTATARDRGIEAGGFCFYNDVRPDAARVTPAAGAAPPSPDLDRTVLRPLADDGRQKDAKFFLFVYELDSTAILRLCADPRFDGAPAFLRDLERAAVAMSTDGAGPGQVRRRLRGRESHVPA